MPFFHGIVTLVSGWVRILTGVELAPSTKVEEVYEGGSYAPAFLQHFFPGKFRVEVRRLNQRKFNGVKSAPAVTGELFSSEVLRWSTSAYQYMVRIKGSTGWLSSFKEIGLVIQNSKKMSKRLVELVRLTSMWVYRDASNPLAVEVIEHPHPECFVDGISAISRSLAIKCVLSNKQATRLWRAQQIWKIRTGETACVIFRMLTVDGLTKGNALVLPRRMMNGYDVRTFAPNIKSEIRTTGWQWVTIEPTYGTIPVKSDDLTHAIYRGVDGLYDDATLMASLKGMLNASFEDMKSGSWMKWATVLADEGDTILHDQDEVDKYASERGLIGRIRVAVAQLTNAGVPINSSQTLMFLMVNGLKNMLLGDSGTGMVWRDKSRHWFPVPWAYAAHIYTKEVLELFGFKMPSTNEGFYHKATHGFVVPGEFFQKNLANHGGPDLDDTVKVHIRYFRRADGALKLAAFLLRNPNDFGEWSVISVSDSGPVFHAYADTPPVVDYAQLCERVPQFTKLQHSLQIGSLPCMTNPTVLDPEFSLKDEERVRQAAVTFPAGVGATVIPKMIWYAMLQRPINELCAPNEDIVDALQQGQATLADISVIQSWIDKTFVKVGSRSNWTMDAFWYATRLPRSIKESSEWVSGSVSESTWVTLHRERETVVRMKLKEMRDWLNANISMPEILQGITWSDEELASMGQELADLLSFRSSMSDKDWVPYLSGRLQTADKKIGEAYTDRKVLRLMYASIVMKQADGRNNYDKWLYSFTAQDQPHPYNWAVRALSRIPS